MLGLPAWCELCHVTASIIKGMTSPSVTTCGAICLPPVCSMGHDCNHNMHWESQSPQPRITPVHVSQQRTRCNLCWNVDQAALSLGWLCRYKEITGQLIEECGFQMLRDDLVHGWLGASPDGLVQPLGPPPSLSSCVICL